MEWVLIRLTKGRECWNRLLEVQRRIVNDFLHDKEGAGLPEARQRNQLLPVQPVEAASEPILRSLFSSPRPARLPSLKNSISV